MPFVLNNSGLTGFLGNTDRVNIVDHNLIKLDAEKIQVNLDSDQQFDASCNLLITLPDFDFGVGNNSIVLHVSLFDAIENETSLEINQTIKPFPAISLTLEEVSFGFRSDFKGGGDWWVKPKASAKLSFKNYFDLPIEKVSLNRVDDKWIFGASIQFEETVSYSTPAIQIELNLGGLRFLQRNNRQAVQLTAGGSIVLPALGLQLTGSGIRVGTTLDGPSESWLECESLGVDLALPPNSEDPTFVFSGTIRDFGKDEKDLDIAGNLQIPPLELEGGGSLIVSEENNSYYISGRLKFVTPQPIGNSGLGVFELQALSGYNVGLDKGENESWYKFLTKNPRGLNAGDNSKFAIKEGSVLAGFGGTIGSLDGFLVNGIVIGVIEFPDFLLIEGRMNVFEEPVPYNTTSDPQLQVWMVLEKSSVTLGAAINYQLPEKSGSFLKLRARLDAFYDLKNSQNWYLRIGHPARPVTAEVAGFIRGKGFVEVTSRGIRGMVSQEVKLRLGPFSGRSSWQVSGKMNYDPFYVAANGSFIIGGEIRLRGVRVYAYGRARAVFIYGTLDGRGGRDFLYFNASVSVSAGVTIRISRFFKIHLSASVKVRISHGRDQTSRIQVGKLDAISGLVSAAEAQDAFVFQRKNTFQAINPGADNTIPPDSIISAHFKRPVTSTAKGVVRSAGNSDPLAQGRWRTDFNLTEIVLQILLDDIDGEVWEDYVKVFSLCKKVSDLDSLKYIACWDKSVDKSTRQLHVLDTRPRNATHNRTHTLEICSHKSQYDFFLHEWNAGEMLMADTWYNNDEDSLALKIHDFSYSGSGKLLHSPHQQDIPDGLTVQIDFLVPEAEQVTGQLRLYRLCSDGEGMQAIYPDPFLEISPNNPLIRIEDTPGGLLVVCDLELYRIEGIYDLLRRCKLLIKVELELTYFQDEFDPEEYLKSLNAHDIVLRPDSQYRFRLIRNQTGYSSVGNSQNETLKFKTGTLMSGYQPVTALDGAKNMDIPRLVERLNRPRSSFDTGQFPKPQYQDDSNKLILSLQGLSFYELLSPWREYPDSHLQTLNPSLTFSVSGLSANGVVITDELPVKVRRSDKSGRWEVTPVNRRNGFETCDLYTFHTKQKDETLLEIDISKLTEPLQAGNAYNLGLEINGEKYLDFSLIQSVYENHAQLCQLLESNIKRVNASANLESLLWDLRLSQRSGETGAFILPFSDTTRGLVDVEHETLKQLLHIDVDRNSLGKALCILVGAEPLLRSDVPVDYLSDCFVSADRTMILKVLQGDEHQVSFDIRSPLIPDVKNPVVIKL